MMIALLIDVGEITVNTICTSKFQGDIHIFCKNELQFQNSLKMDLASATVVLSMLGI